MSKTSRRRFLGTALVAAAAGPVALALRGRTPAGGEARAEAALMTFYAVDPSDPRVARVP